MSEEQESTQETQDGSAPHTSNTWDEVGQQFQALGESLASAFRTAWENEDNRQQMHKIKLGLEGMADQVSQAVKDSSTSPAAQQVRSEAKRAAVNLHTAGKQTLDEAKPHLVTALRQVNTELQKLIERMESEEPARTSPDSPDTEKPSS